MIGSRRRALAALAAVVGLAVGCAGPSTGGGALWRESPAARAAPDLARVNTLLAASIQQLEGLVELSEKARMLAEAYWPGALSIVLPSGGRLAIPRRGWTLSTRVPAHELTRAPDREREIHGIAWLEQEPEDLAFVDRPNR